MVYCAALNCRNATSGAYKNSSVSFYGFPLQNKPLLRQWIQNMGRDMETPSKYQRLCSDHFEESSFERDPSKMRKNRRLLKEAVPNKFILGEDGSWLVGTPRSFCDVMRNRSRKRLRIPERWRVPGTFANGAQGPRLEDWQNEFYKKLLKENYASLSILAKGYPLPKSNILAGEAAWNKDWKNLEGRKIPASLRTGHGGAMIRSQPQSAGGTQRHGSSPGASLDLPCRSSASGETSGSHHSSATDRANPMGKGRGKSFLTGREVDEFRRFLLCQQSHPEEAQVPWFICTDCGKSFSRHTYLLRHQKCHTGLRPHTCTECGRSFLEKPALTSHLRTHFQIICVPKAFLG